MCISLVITAIYLLDVVYSWKPMSFKLKVVIWYLSHFFRLIQYNTNKFVTRPTCQFASEMWSAAMAPKQLGPTSGKI